MTAHTAIIIVADNVPLGFKLSLQAILENCCAFSCLCLPSLCSVCLYCAPLPPAFFVIHSHVIVLVVMLKTIKIAVFFLYLVLLCAEVLLLLKPLWYSSLRCMLTTIWLSNSTFVTLYWYVAL